MGHLMRSKEACGKLVLIEREFLARKYIVEFHGDFLNPTS